MEENTLALTIPSQGELEQMTAFAEIIVASKLAPKSFDTKEKVVLAICYGKELGVSGMQSLQGLQVINGKIGVGGDLARALVENDPRCEGINDEIVGEGEERGVQVTVNRVGKPPVVRTFTVKEAKAARLWGKEGPWSQYPQRMVYYRALGFALRDSFSDVLKGLKTSEELQDYQIDYAKDARVIADTTYTDSRSGSSGVVNLGELPSSGSTEVPKRGRGRPVGSTKKQEPPKEEINETPKADNEGESGKERLHEDVPTQTGEVLPDTLSLIRAELAKANQSESRLLSILLAWKLLPHESAQLEDVPESTRVMVLKRWGTVEKAF